MPILLHLVTLLRGLLPIDICADLLDWFGKSGVLYPLPHHRRHEREHRHHHRHRQHHREHGAMRCDATRRDATPRLPHPPARPPGILDTMDHFKGRN